MTEYSPAKIREYPKIFPNFQNRACCEKYLKDNKDNSLHLAWKYARIFVLGHYLFLDAHSFPRATLSENCSLLGTDNRELKHEVFSTRRRRRWAVETGTRFTAHDCPGTADVELPAATWVKLFWRRSELVSDLAVFIVSSHFSCGSCDFDRFSTYFWDKLKLSFSVSSGRKWPQNQTQPNPWCRLINPSNRKWNFISLTEKTEVSHLSHDFSKEKGAREAIFFLRFLPPGLFDESRAHLNANFYTVYTSAYKSVKSYHLVAKIHFWKKLFGVVSNLKLFGDL